MRKLLLEAGLDGQIEVDSAGTGDWHVGRPADPRATEAALGRGYELVGSARQVRVEDFERFDLVIAMDRSNHADLMAIAPEGGRQKIRMLREFGDGERLDVPDPYYGADDGFGEVLDIVERCCTDLLQQLEAGELTAR